ncbi:unnamed protein product [Pleuronectes platessa]|uniref:Uncharacterized protein n=1 Tax=Pleuronectes platessa TaxID=8262 RepID=A0A9N7ZFA4_PLEPL|nr:unnamed protein product [Pleuronectes platessa]
MRRRMRRRIGNAVPPPPPVVTVTRDRGKTAGLNVSGTAGLGSVEGHSKAEEGHRASLEVWSATSSNITSNQTAVVGTQCLKTVSDERRREGDEEEEEEEEEEELFGEKAERTSEDKRNSVKGLTASVQMEVASERLTAAATEPMIPPQKCESRDPQTEEADAQSDGCETLADRSGETGGNKKEEEEEEEDEEGILAALSRSLGGGWDERKLSVRGAEAMATLTRTVIVIQQDDSRSDKLQSTICRVIALPSSSVPPPCSHFPLLLISSLILSLRAAGASYICACDVATEIEEKAPAFEPSAQLSDICRVKISCLTRGELSGVEFNICSAAQVGAVTTGAPAVG